MNHADESVRHTRIHEVTYLHPERHTAPSATVIACESPSDNVEEQNYPVPSANARNKLAVCYAHAAAERNVNLWGCFADLKHYDLHQVVGSVRAKLWTLLSR